MLGSPRAARWVKGEGGWAEVGSLWVEAGSLWAKGQSVRAVELQAVAGLSQLVLAA